MSFIVENTAPDSKYKTVPPGNHLGRCYRIVDLGTQKSEYQGEVKLRREVLINWELHGKDDDGNPLVTEDERPLSISRTYTLSWSENSNLRKSLQSWRGKPWTDKEVMRFDLKNILGQWAMITVVHREAKNGKTYANVDNLAPVPSIIKQHGLPQGFNEPTMFKLAEPDWALYDTLGKRLQETIALSPEYAAAKRGPAPTTSSGSGFDDMEDDMPF